MKKFSDLTEDQQVSVLHAAAEWQESQFEHVQELRQSTQHSYPPSGSDIFHPELWKAAHWRWFNGRMQKKVKV